MRADRLFRHGHRRNVEEGSISGDNESVDSDDFQLSEHELRDKEYERLQTDHKKNTAKQITAKHLYELWEAARAWASERKAQVARSKRQKFE
jgi:hypothetical protein